MCIILQIVRLDKIPPFTPDKINQPKKDSVLEGKVLVLVACVAYGISAIDDVQASTKGLLRLGSCDYSQPRTPDRSLGDEAGGCRV